MGTREAQGVRGGLRATREAEQRGTLRDSGSERVVGSTKVEDVCNVLKEMVMPV